VRFLTIDLFQNLPVSFLELFTPEKLHFEAVTRVIGTVCEKARKVPIQLKTFHAIGFPTSLSGLQRI
jgi:hypothetical protein